MTPTEAAWLAGIIDGEGSVSKKGNGYTITITMTCETTIRKIFELTGGNFRERPVESRGGNTKPWHKDAWNWWVSGDDADRVARAVEPYVVTKRDLIIDLIIRFSEYNQRRSPYKGKRKPSSYYRALKEGRQQEAEILEQNLPKPK
jgi:hypothetical protein